MFNLAQEHSFIEAIRQLFTPLAYIRIKHPQKVLFDFYMPILMAVSITLGLYFFPKPIIIFGDKGLISIFTSLIQLLVGFYIAALAAVATFQRDGLDDQLAGEPATLSVIRRGVKQELKLSRRKFVCYLFGYLSFMGIVLYFLGATSGLLSESARILMPVNCVFIVKWGFVFLYTLAASNLIITTLLGLHYLTDRIHRP